MLPAMLHISKCMWLMFYLFLKILIVFIFKFFNEGCIPVNNGWHTEVVRIPQPENP
jgi:hypothetical protein